MLFLREKEKYYFNKGEMLFLNPSFKRVKSPGHYKKTYSYRGKTNSIILVLKHSQQNQGNTNQKRTK